MSFRQIRASAPAPAPYLLTKHLPSMDDAHTVAPQHAKAHLSTSVVNSSSLKRSTADGGSSSVAKKRVRASKASEVDDEEEDDDDHETSESESEGNEGSSSSSSSEEEEESSDDDEQLLPQQSAPAPTPAPAPAPTPAPMYVAVPVAMKASRENDLHPRAIRRPLEYALWSAERQKRWDGIHKNPNLYYLHHLPPGVAPRRNSPEWSDAERTMFMFSLTAYPPEGAWGLFSLNMPGRTGLECEAFFKRLQREGLVSSTPGRKNTPPTIKLETKDKKYRFETTPILVTRPRGVPAPQHQAPPTGLLSAADEEAARNAELVTAIAQLSFKPMPGTEGLKASHTLRAQAPEPTPQQLAKERKRQQQQAERERLEAAEEKERLANAARKAAAAAAAEEKERAEKAARKAAVAAQRAMERLQAAPSTPQAPTPSTPSTGGASKKTPPIASLDGAINHSALEWSDMAPASGSSAASADRKHRAAEKDLFETMRDLSASLGASRAAAAAAAAAAEAATKESVDAVMTTATPVVESLVSTPLDEPRVPVSRKVDASVVSSASGGAAVAPSPPLSVLERELVHASTRAHAAARDDEADRVAFPVEHFVRSRVVSRSSPGTSNLLPFSGFSIPAHTPHGAKRRRVEERVRRLEQPVPVQALGSAAPPRFHAPRVELSIDHVDGRVRMHDLDAGIEVPTSADEAVSMARATAVARGTARMDVDAPVPGTPESEEEFASFSAELTKLEASFRLKLRRLAAHQTEQLTRVRTGYGLAPLAPGEEDDGASYARVRVSSAMVSAPFGQAHETFTGGCKHLLASYHHREVDTNAIAGVLARCRTFGEAVLEIRLNHKTLLKELQREHATGRDVLTSLKTAGLLQ